MCVSVSPKHSESAVIQMMAWHRTGAAFIKLNSSMDKQSQSHKSVDEITEPLQNFNGCAVEV